MISDEEFLAAAHIVAEESRIRQSQDMGDFNRRVNDRMHNELRISYAEWYKKSQNLSPETLILYHRLIDEFLDE